MKVTKVFSDELGESHFGEVEIELADAGRIGRLSARQKASGIVFRENDESYDYDWHNAPARQYVILLDGNIELETSDGEIRRFTGGDVLLVEDTAGRGHRTRTVDGRKRRSLFVTLD
ncbi:MAG: hypothetical protein V1794_13765 [Candidatus Glassbacteria bacterium]